MEETIGIPDNNNNSAGNAGYVAGEQMAKEKIKVGCDQEAWVKARLQTMLNMAIALRSNKKVAAEDGMLKSAVDGLINGTAIEIIQTVGLEPEYINLQRINW